MMSPDALHQGQSRSATVPRAKPTLMTLPPELRNEIYMHLFKDETYCIKPEYFLPGILTTCRQAYAEAIRLYYAAATFRCLDEQSTVQWLVCLPEESRDLIMEVRYDTRWMIFIRDYIPLPGAEAWLFQRLVSRLSEKGFDLHAWNATSDGEGRVKVSWYQGGKGGGIRWTDKPGLIESVQQRR